MAKNTLLILLIAVALSGCASTSRHWQEDMVVKDRRGKPILIDGKEQVVKVDCFRQTGIIKAKHSENTEAESQPYAKLPDYPPRVD